MVSLCCCQKGPGKHSLVSTGIISSVVSAPAENQYKPAGAGWLQTRPLECLTAAQGGRFQVHVCMKFGFWCVSED